MRRRNCPRYPLARARILDYCVDVSLRSFDLIQKFDSESRALLLVIQRSIVVLCPGHWHRFIFALLQDFKTSK
jgi:hypothetical protein